MAAIEIRNGIESRIKGFQELPSLPQVLLKLLDACNSSEAPPQEISKIISADPSISAKLMRLVNSAYIGLSNKVTDIDKAVLYLGTETVKNLAISTSVLETFSQVKGDIHFNLNQFWWHSFMCACLSRRIAKETGYASPEEAFLGGLMHDIGKLVLWTNFRPEYTKILKKTAGSGHDLFIAEKTEIGATHCEIGAQLIRRWNLKSFMADAVFYHHENPARIKDAFPLLKIIFAANLICKSSSNGLAGRSRDVKSILNLNESKILEITASASEETIDVANMFDIPVEIPSDPEKFDEDVQQAKRKDLAQEVKTHSLLHGTLQNLLAAENRESILKTADAGLQLLFDVQKIFFFVYELEKNILTGITPRESSHNELISTLAIPVEGSNNLVIQSLNQKAVIDSFSQSIGDGLTIADEQIIRLLESEGTLCIPLTALNQKTGVIVLGVSELQARRLMTQRKLLTMLANQTALCLHLDNIKRTQAIRIENERREASTAIARKVTHEVNNPLGIIKNYIKILAQKLPQEYQAHEELKIIGEEIDRVSQIIKQLTAFSGPKVGKHEPVDINALLSGIVKIIEKSLLKPSNTKIRLNLDPNLPSVSTDRNSLVQVIMNLIKNASEAMPDGGMVMLSTSLVSPFSRKLIADEGTKTGRLQITVRDDGPGIPEQIQARMFEPSNSTKDEGHYGLGLSIVHSIVKELKGTIDWRSEPGFGTEFKITLPLS